MKRETREAVSSEQEIPTVPIESTQAMPIESTQVDESSQTTFRLIWDQIESAVARQLFLLAAYFPEAARIPLWLLGLAAGLSEQRDVRGPFAQAKKELCESGLLKELASGEVWLQPMIRAFGQQLVMESDAEGRALLEEAAGRLAAACTDLHALEQYTQSHGYWQCVEWVRAIREYAVQLGIKESTQQIEKVENWLRRESHLLADNALWPDRIPSLFYQQLYNRA